MLLAAQRENNLILRTAIVTSPLYCCASLPIGKLKPFAQGCAGHPANVQTLNWYSENVPHMTKILLVEDSKFIRLATERALARAGYTVSVAIDGEGAIDAARQNAPDLILLDLLLPKMGGQEVLKALKGDPATAQIPVVVLTGMSSKNAQRLRQDGAHAFLGKESLALDKSSEGLLEAVARILGELTLKAPPGTMAAGK